ncbi:hypothetical protein ACVWWK_007994 [Bradyrhizobium sp. LB9.1b]
MAETFNPAPHDKHADDLHEALAADRYAKLDAGLERYLPGFRSRERRPAGALEGRCGCRQSLALEQGEGHLRLAAGTPDSDRFANALLAMC